MCTLENLPSAAISFPACLSAPVPHTIEYFPAVERTGIRVSAIDFRNLAHLSALPGVLCVTALDFCFHLQGGVAAFHRRRIQPASALLHLYRTSLRDDPKSPLFSMGKYESHGILAPRRRQKRAARHAAQGA